MMTLIMTLRPPMAGKGTELYATLSTGESYVQPTSSIGVKVCALQPSFATVAVSTGGASDLNVLCANGASDVPPAPPLPPPPPPSPATPPGTCLHTCSYAADQDCDDGGPGAEVRHLGVPQPLTLTSPCRSYHGNSPRRASPHSPRCAPQYNACAFGTDCEDCGSRIAPSPPGTVGSPPPPPPPLPNPPAASPPPPACSNLVDRIDARLQNKWCHQVCARACKEHATHHACTRGRCMCVCFPHTRAAAPGSCYSRNVRATTCRRMTCPRAGASATRPWRAPQAPSAPPVA